MQGNITIKLILFFTVFFFHPVPASALLVEGNLHLSGDALITFDSETGLEWLDLTQTAGLSGYDIRYRDAGGWISSGFRYATLEEVTSLFEAVGYVGDSEEFNAHEYENALTLITLLGATYETQGAIPWNTMGQSIVGMTWSEEFVNVGLNLHGVAVVTNDREPWLGYFDVYGGSVLYNNRQPDIGSFLVRSSPIPEPSTILLFGAGLAGFAGVARRKKK